MAGKFELNSLVVGQIKELLHSFNLPTIPVYTENTVLYNNRTYIKGNQVVKYVDGEFIEMSPYKYNLEIINLTKNFIIKSSIYDQYTHKYFGDYLRFLRDYKNVNLMGMYNCFFEDELVNASAQIDLSTGSKFVINTSDKVNNYYIVPIKLNSYYTIAINSCSHYELACILHNNTYVSTDESKELSSNTYRKVLGSTFSHPYLLNTYFTNAESFWRKENDIKLLIKIPKKVDTSIVILEGNWLDSASVIDGLLTSTQVLNDSKQLPQTLLSKNALFKYNNTLNYPFADKLVEYILGNVIDPTDTIGENISRVQEDYYLPRYRYIKGPYGVWTDQLRKDLYNESLKPDITKGSKRYSSNISKTSYVLDSEGHKIQDSSGRYITEDDVKAYRYRFIDLYDDITGYVDRDVETLVGVDIEKAKERGDYVNE